MKNILYMAVSIDGRTTGADDNTDWVEDADIERFDSLMEECGVMVMGRRTYEGFGEDLPNDRALMVVFTTHAELQETKLDNVRFTNEDPGEVLEKLHNEGYEKIMLAGGESLNSSLLKEDLIDEIRLIVKPILLGSGKRLFNDTDISRSFKLVGAEQLPNGAMELTYEKL